MPNVASVTQRPVSALTACCLAFIVLDGLWGMGAKAQCSQATQPQAASSIQCAATSTSEPLVNDKEESSSSSDAPANLRFATGSAVTVLEETELQVITETPISSLTTKPGAELPFTVTRDVVVDGILVIPCGARVYGTVVTAKQAGRLVGASNLTLELTQLSLGGKTYPLYTPPFKVVGQSKTRPTVNKAAVGAGVAAVGMDWRAQTVPVPVKTGARLASDGIAAGLGAGVGTAIAAKSPPSIASIPSESQLEFTLASPIAVFPVDQKTATRLAQGLRRGGPVLYVRGESQ